MGHCYLASAVFCGLSFLGDSMSLQAGDEEGCGEEEGEEEEECEDDEAIEDWRDDSKTARRFHCRCSWFFSSSCSLGDWPECRGVAQESQEGRQGKWRMQSGFRP